MSISQSMLPEFDLEMANTRKILALVPQMKHDWRPHEKSYNMGELATHIANLPTWTGYTIELDSLDLAPKDGEPIPRVPAVKTNKELLEMFDQNIVAARKALENASDDRLMQNWSLLTGGHEIFTLPKIAVLRSFVMNHMIHHRAQLGVYLRLNDIPLPGLYGPTADENA